VIGVADTGIDVNSCFFKDTTTTVPYNKVSSTHRKLVTYITYADSQENGDSGDNNFGHGTHVAGTLAGFTTSTSTMIPFNGIAPGAKLAFFDIAKYDSTGAVMLYPPSDINLGT